MIMSLGAPVEDVTPDIRTDRKLWCGRVWNRSAMTFIAWTCENLAFFTGLSYLGPSV